jgi:hypothetical protein
LAFFISLFILYFGPNSAFTSLDDDVDNINLIIVTIIIIFIEIIDIT